MGFMATMAPYCDLAPGWTRNEGSRSAHAVRRMVQPSGYLSVIPEVILPFRYWATLNIFASWSDVGAVT